MNDGIPSIEDASSAQELTALKDAPTAEAASNAKEFLTPEAASVDEALLPETFAGKLIRDGSVTWLVEDGKRYRVPDLRTETWLRGDGGYVPIELEPEELAKFKASFPEGGMYRRRVPGGWVT